MTSAPTPKAGRNLRACVLFLGVALSLLLLDLVTKSVSFAFVADRPVVLTRSGDDNTTLVNYRLEDGSRVELPRRFADDPASAIPDHEGITVVPYVLKLRLMLNTGAVFGLGKGQQWFFALVSIVAVIIIGYVFYRSDARAWVFHVPLAMILAGALGNFYDRIVYNSVRDMLYLFPGVHLPFGWRWPAPAGFEGSPEIYPWIFNIADVALVVGVISVIIVTWIHDRRLAAAQKAKS